MGRELSKGSSYSLVSIGNGWAYELTYGDESFFFQDDDARQFEADRDGLQKLLPGAPEYVIFRELAGMYRA
jgi:hypothetical protein